MHRNTQTALICCVKTRRCRKGGGHAAPPAHPPPVRPSHRRPPFRLALVCSPLTATGDGKRALTLSKGQISHSACLKALGTKAGEFTSIKPALAFVRRKRRTRSGPFSRPAPPGVRCQGQPNVCPGGPLNAVPPPRHMHGRARKRSRARTHTPPCPRHSPAWRRTITPEHIKRKAPQLLLKSNGFAPKDGSSKVAALGAPGQRTSPPRDEWQIQNIPNIKCSRVPGKIGLRLLESGGVKVGKLIGNVSRENLDEWRGRWLGTRT